MVLLICELYTHLYVANLLYSAHFPNLLLGNVLHVQTMIIILMELYLVSVTAI